MRTFRNSLGATQVKTNYRGLIHSRGREGERDFALAAGIPLASAV